VKPRPVSLKRPGNEFPEAVWRTETRDRLLGTVECGVRTVPYRTVECTGMTNEPRCERQIWLRWSVLIIFLGRSRAKPILQATVQVCLLIVESRNGSPPVMAPHHFIKGPSMDYGLVRLTQCGGAPQLGMLELLAGIQGKRWGAIFGSLSLGRRVNPTTDVTQFGL
jgi:hypothetical protein